MAADVENFKALLKAKIETQAESEALKVLGFTQPDVERTLNPRDDAIKLVPSPSSSYPLLPLTIELSITIAGFSEQRRTMCQEPLINTSTLRSGGSRMFLLE